MRRLLLRLKVVGREEVYYAYIQIKQSKRLYRVKSKNLFLGFLCYASFFGGISMSS